MGFFLTVLIGTLLTLFCAVVICRLFLKLKPMRGYHVALGLGMGFVVQIVLHLLLRPKSNDFYLLMTGAMGCWWGTFAAWNIQKQRQQ